MSPTQSEITGAWRLGKVEDVDFDKSLSPSVIGAYERAIADLARLLYQRGHTVLLLISNTEEYHANYPPINIEL